MGGRFLAGHLKIKKKKKKVREKLPSHIKQYVLAYISADKRIEII